jgi:hypothetical protein
MRRTFFQRTQSITGAVLVGLGILIFCWNLDRAAIQFAHLLGTIPRQTLGVLPAMIVAASRVQTYAGAHQRFLQAILLYLWTSSWPLLLVAAGAVLSQDPVTDHADPRLNKK